MNPHEAELEALKRSFRIASVVVICIWILIEIVNGW